MPAINKVLALASALPLLVACAPTFLAVAEPGGDARTKARIADTFGPGTPAAALRAELLREGFTIADDPETRFHSAFDRPQNLPCYSATRIDWLEDRRGRVARIQVERHDCS